MQCETVTADPREAIADRGGERRGWGPTILLGVAVMIVAVTVVARPLAATAASPRLPAHGHRHTNASGHNTVAPTGDVTEVTPGVTRSPNWSGYVAYPAQFTPVTFTEVSAQWVEPTVTCPKKDAWTLFWVGFDGWPSSDGTVEQGGTSAQCVNGVPRYTAFYEMWPSESVQTAFSVNAGDHISARVDYTSSDTFVITVADADTGQFLNKTTTCATCARSSAEWVAESPSHFGTDRWFPLADYGTMAFTDATTAATTEAAQNVSGAISDPQWQSSGIERMAGAAKPRATVSGLENAASSSTFSDTWSRK